MDIESQLFFAIFGLLQLIIVSIAAWTLRAVISQGTRITKMETMLESSLIEDIKDLKQRVRNVEDKCNVCQRAQQ